MSELVYGLRNRFDDGHLITWGRQEWRIQRKQTQHYKRYSPTVITIEPLEGIMERDGLTVVDVKKGIPYPEYSTCHVGVSSGGVSPPQREVSHCASQLPPLESEAGNKEENKMPWNFSDTVEAKNESEARKKFNKLFKEKYSHLGITRGQFKAEFKAPTKQVTSKEEKAV